MHKRDYLHVKVSSLNKNCSMQAWCILQLHYKMPLELERFMQHRQYLLVSGI